MTLPKNDWWEENFDSVIATIVILVATGLLIYVWFGLSPERVDEKVSITMAIATSTVAIATGIYAWHTRRLAKASVEMAEEMREQRIIASRPLVIQKAVSIANTPLVTFTNTPLVRFDSDWFSHFEVYNAGNGPAIQIETSLLDKNKNIKESRRESFLRGGDSMQFTPGTLDKASMEESAFYVVSEYQSILSRSQQQIWYQTWLAFKLVKDSTVGNLYVNGGELEFKEVSQKDRIDAFGSRSKPK